MAAIRRPVRSRPIRVLLIGMFAVPLVSLIALWILSTVLTVPGAISDRDFHAVSVAITSPDVSTLTIELPAEQQETYVWLLSGRQAPKATLLATRQAITKALPGAESALLTGSNQLSASGKADLNTVEADLRSIPGLRQSVDAGTMTAADAFEAYSNIIDAQFQWYYASTLDRGGSLQAIAVGATDSALALEMAGREATLVGGALAITRGQLDPGARQLFISSAANRQFLMGQALSLLSPDMRADYVTLVNSAPYKQFAAMEGQITDTGSSTVPVDAKAWASASGTVLGAMLTAETANASRLAAKSTAASNGLLTEAILAGGVGLAAVVISVFLLLWFGRRMTGDLTRLNHSVRAMSEERLPRVVAQLSRGDDVDVTAESPPPAPSRISEISQIARSFGVVQEAAVTAAVDQARLRKGVNQVFLNISMRNQSLLHRQLGMLDSMERRTSDPSALADLFRLDHLTTRMRRHAEGLIILSGSTPGRGWHDPVPVVDVLRAAVAEVEDYVRVDVVSESLDLVAGNAVNNVIHLIAELVENATVFSPPNTRIEVRADRAGTGVVAEVEDRGLGLSEEELADINRRLASPPEFDPANSEQLGLFVVSRLAARHAIKVSLRQSVYGGTTAILVIPFGVIVRDGEADSFSGKRDVPADGQPEDPAASQTAVSWPEPAASPAAVSWPEPAASPAAVSWPEPGAATALPSFGAAGRHRPALTGRRADTGLPDEYAADGWPDRSSATQAPALPSLPRPPWELAWPEPEPATPAPTDPPVGPPAGRPRLDFGAAASWPGAFSRPLAASPASPAAGHQDTPFALGSPRGTGSPHGPEAGSHLGMPVRVPQASLAPQLRGRRADGGQPGASRSPFADERPPEATRNMMSQMQQGWELGRIDDLDDPAGAPDNGPER